MANRSDEVTVAKLQKVPTPMWPGLLRTLVWTAASERGLVAIDHWGDGHRFKAKLKKYTADDPTVADEKVEAGTEQLQQCLRSGRQKSALNIDCSYKIPFWAEVLHTVQAISHGNTRTYSHIAPALGKPEAERAVGRANATNPYQA